MDDEQWNDKRVKKLEVDLRVAEELKRAWKEEATYWRVHSEKLGIRLENWIEEAEKLRAQLEDR